MSSISRRRFLGATAGGALSLSVAPTGRALADARGGGRHVALDLWPRPAAARLEHLIRANASSDRYAAFDADNTIWHYDLEESLLPFLEMKGVLSREKIDPSLKLISFRDGESLYSYYLRLCEIDDKVGYPWIAQVFSGLSLHELKGYVDELFSRSEPIPITYYQGDQVVHDTVNPPRIYPAQRQLIRQLRSHGITVFVVTAAHEELVRMVVSDPAYDLNVEPEKVIGVTTLLRDPRTEELTTARKQIADGHFLDSQYPLSKHRRMVITPYLWTPGTWYVGKLAGIKDYISDYERPVLVAGDSPSDWSMLFYTDVRHAGARLWVNRSQDYTDRLEKERRQRADEQRAARVPVDADRAWITVRPSDLERR